MDRLIELFYAVWAALACAGVLFVAAGVRTLHQAKQEGPGKWTGVAGLGLVFGGMFLIFPPIAIIGGAVYVGYKINQ